MQDCPNDPVLLRERKGNYKLSGSNSSVSMKVILKHATVLMRIPNPVGGNWFWWQYWGIWSNTRF